ncbi:lysine exporter LysO family protein [Moraxella sp. Tifton1]|uniref:lysine exporter LysO family protein n=1 Tax=Moraxella oculi TaxID=2940516 RepID=UPI00201269BD|nr:lysine exporter LysO family protein [Moraxella sp. Tifton1]MCL1622697.1 lysine exporter LysO family protein [Moraxella sp. Tifton1]
MNGLITLFLILTPMFIGFALPTHTDLVKMAERTLNYLIYLILIVIGIELGLVDDLAEKVGEIALYLGTLAFLTIGFGSVALWILDHRSQVKAPVMPNKTKISLSGSIIQLSCLALGFLAATFLPAQFIPPKSSTTVLLMGLLFLVGISIKGSGISLKEAMLNKKGVQISIVFTLSTLLAGVVFALIFQDVSITKGLALSSGFGWYSLSGPVMTDAYGAVWGSVALLNDLIREIFALIFIPYFMRYSSSAAIGLGGVTSLDFTLPTLTASGGTKIIPTIISFGFITNIISPIMMVFFSTLG